MKKSKQEIRNYTRERLIYINNLFHEVDTSKMSGEEAILFIRKTREVITHAVSDSGVEIANVKTGEVIIPEIVKEASRVFYRMYKFTLSDLSTKNKHRPILSARQMYTHVLSEIFMVDNSIIAVHMGRSRADIINSIGRSSELIRMGDYYIMAHEKFLEWGKQRKAEMNNERKSKQ